MIGSQKDSMKKEFGNKSVSNPVVALNISPATPLLTFRSMETVKRENLDSRRVVIRDVLQQICIAASMHL